MKKLSFARIRSHNFLFLIDWHEVMFVFFDLRLYSLINWEASSKIIKMYFKWVLINRRNSNFNEHVVSTKSFTVESFTALLQIVNTVFWASSRVIRTIMSLEKCLPCSRRSNCRRQASNRVANPAALIAKLAGSMTRTVFSSKWHQFYPQGCWVCNPVAVYWLARRAKKTVAPLRAAESELSRLLQGMRWDIWLEYQKETNSWPSSRNLWEIRFKISTRFENEVDLSMEKLSHNKLNVEKVTWSRPRPFPAPAKHLGASGKQFSRSTESVITFHLGESLELAQRFLDSQKTLDIGIDFSISLLACKIWRSVVLEMPCELHSPGSGKLGSARSPGAQREVG